MSLFCGRSDILILAGNSTEEATPMIPDVKDPTFEAILAAADYTY